MMDFSNAFWSDELHAVIAGKTKNDTDVYSLYRTHWMWNDELKAMSEPSLLKSFYVDPAHMAPDYDLMADINREIMLNDWSRWNVGRVKQEDNVEISEAVYDHLLGCVPPRNWNGTYFEVGEADFHDNNGRAIHRACWMEDGKFFTGYPKNVKDYPRRLADEA